MKLSESGGVWLSAKNCQEGQIVEFLTEGEWRNSQKFTYDDGNPVRQLVFKVKHENEEKQLTIIKPSRLALIEAWGDDTLEWVGKKATIKLALNTQGGKSIILQPIVDKSEKTLQQQMDDIPKEEGQETPF